MIERKLENYMSQAECQQNCKADAIVPGINTDSCKPQSNNRSHPQPRDLMPANDGSFRKPVQVVIRVGEGDQSQYRNSGNRGIDIAQVADVGESQKPREVEGHSLKGFKTRS